MNKFIVIILALNILIISGCVAQVDLTKKDANSLYISEKKATRIKTVTCENNIIKFHGNGLLSYNYERLLNGRFSIDFYNVSASSIKIDENCKNIVTGPTNVGHSKVNFIINLKNNIDDNFLIKKGTINKHVNNNQIVYNFVNNVYVSDINNKKIYDKINKFEKNQYILNKEVSFINEILESNKDFSAEPTNKNKKENIQKINIAFSNPVKVLESDDKKDYIRVKIKGNIGFIKNVLSTKTLKGKILKEIVIKNNKDFAYIYFYRVNKSNKDFISIDTINNYLVIFSTINYEKVEKNK